MVGICSGVASLPRKVNGRLRRLTFDREPALADGGLLHKLDLVSDSHSNTACQRFLAATATLWATGISGRSETNASHLLEGNGRIHGREGHQEGEQQRNGQAAASGKQRHCTHVIFSFSRKRHRVVCASNEARSALNAAFSCSLG